MFTESKAFASIAVIDLEAARKFYGKALGLEEIDAPEDATPAERKARFGNRRRVAWFRDSSGNILTVREEKN